MSNGPSRRSSLFDDPRGEDQVFAAARRGEETVGAALGRVRQTHGLELAEVAQHLRIRETFLVALEEGDLNRLPGNTYAMGFVRSYANLLGVSGEEAVALFKEERAGETDPAALVFPEPVAESRIPKGAILFISVLLAAAAYGGWYYMSAHDMDLADLVPEVPAALRDAPSPEGTSPDQVTTVPPSEMAQPRESPLPPAPVPSGKAAVAPEPSPPAAAPMPEATPAPEPSTPEPARPESSESAGVAPSGTGETVPPPPAVGAPAEPPAEETGTAAAASETPPPSGESQTARSTAAIELRAKSDSWVQIRGQGGRVVLMRILRAGDSYMVPNEPGLTLMTGNAGAIEISVDGEAVPSIGPVGAVRRDVELDAERLKAGTAVQR